jgi:Asp-tRNA(Asn)/Glu-tRNA(Gln) amidotransferase A subunit family amidase
VDDPAFPTAAELVAALRERRLSSVELLDHYLAAFTG